MGASEAHAARARVLARYAATPHRLRDGLAAAGDRSDPEGWGPHETIRHLIAVERDVWWVRFDELRTEPEPRWAWTEPGLEPGLESATIDELVARFGTSRARSISIIDAFDEADWGRAGVHATYGRLDVAGLLSIAADHDAEHLWSLGLG